VIGTRAERNRMLVVLLILLALQFYVRPLLGYPRIAPDFLLIGLLIYCIRSRPGDAALAGFAVGLVSDALTPSSFGAGALANTLVAYLAAWGRAVFFADNLLVNAGFFAIGLWLRDLIVLLASSTVGHGAAADLLLWSTLKALTTAVAGVMVLVIFRSWLSIRLAE
jgi:rod shape-determining protein MreD